MLCVRFSTLEWFSIERCKTKTKVITLANHKGPRQYNEPIKAQSKLRAADEKRGKTRESELLLVWVLLLIG